MQYIKVNFPRNEENFQSGNGEGMWVIVADDIAEKYANDETGITSFGVLDNDSVYYPELKAGTEVVFELRGTHRPVALIDGFLDNFTAISDEEFENMKRKIYFENFLKSVGKHIGDEDD